MGLMVGSVFVELLRDLQRESHPLAGAVRDIMFNRTTVGVTYYSSAGCKPGPCVCYNCTHGTGNATTDCPSDAAHARTVTIYQCVSWVDNPFPFGSEFAWDSTGQEESEESRDSRETRLDLRHHGCPIEDAREDRHHRPVANSEVGRRYLELAHAA